MPSGSDLHLANLKDAIQAGKLVAIIGTGVSRQVAESLLLNGHEIVTWIGLVRHGIDHCCSLGLITKDDSTDLHTMASMRKVERLIHVAEEITTALTKNGKGQYQSWLDDTIGKLRVKDPRLIHALVKITNYIASLNYDTLAEQVTQRASVSWNRQDRVSDVINGKKVHTSGADRDAILHPHGSVEDAESVVLGTSSYGRVIDNKHAQAIQLFFAVGHTMVFVGCAGTFDDPNFSQFVTAATAVLKETTKSHFVLCRSSEVEGWKNRIPWLHPISYGDNYEDLAPFLESLAKYRGDPPPEPPQTPTPVAPPGGPAFAAEWQKITQKVKPSLMTDLVTLGRKPAVEKLEQLANGQLSNIGLQTRFPREITSFIAGFLALRDQLGTSNRNRWKLIHDADEWTHASDEKNVRNILVVDPDFEFEANRTSLTQAAIANGHAIIYATLLGRADDTDVIPLGQPNRNDLTELLKKNGVPASKAEKLVHQSNGIIPLLIRYLNGTVDKPAWADPKIVGKLRPLALLGGWRTDRASDVAAIGAIIGSDYHQWLSDLFPALHGKEPPFVHNQSLFRPVSRYENWQILAPYLTDMDLERFQAAAIAALCDDNPKLDLPSGEQLFSGLDRENPAHSQTLREGFSETLALLGAKPEALQQCSPNKAREVVFLVLQSVLADADWKRWASLGSLVSLLAEADPQSYLRFVTSDLARADNSAIKQLFSHVDEGIFADFHHSGIVWSLEVLAWKPELLKRVALILAELDQLPLPENMGNRPIGALRTTLLPWLPQTLATVAERRAAVEMVIREFPEIGWKLLLMLLPEHHGVSGYNQRPLWRDWIPAERDEGTTINERREQEKNYAELALNFSLQNPEKLKELFDHLLYLPENAFRTITSALQSDAVTKLPEQTRLPLWQRAVDEVRKHRKFADADWAAPSDIILQIEKIANAIEPRTPFVRHQRLFNFEHHHFRDSDDYNESMRKIRSLREEAVQELLNTLGIDQVLQLAAEVAYPYHVGVALGKVGSLETDAHLLPTYIKHEGKLNELCRGYVWTRYDNLGQAWFSDLQLENWNAEQIGTFFWWLPFTREVWERAESLLGSNTSAYWQLGNIHPYGTASEILAAVEKLLDVGRGVSALRGVEQLIDDEHSVSAELALRAVQAFLQSWSGDNQNDVHALRDVIQFLQKAPDADAVELGRIEWNLLPLLDRHSGGSPVTLEQSLADSPSFFFEVIKACYRGKGEPKPSPSEITEEKTRNAERGYRLLRVWHIPPGTSKNHEFDPSALEAWIAEVQKLSSASNHWGVAQTHIGQVLIYAPSDPSGLSLHHGVAKILDQKDHDDMRRGYRMGLFNQRGAYFVGGGKADREQQAHYEAEAKSIDAAGFPHLAATLWSLAESYARDAEREEKRLPDE